MSRKISDFDGQVVAPNGTYTNGNVKDDVLGNDGTKVNVKSTGDMFQFFQRIMADVGITANSLADNDTNGYQFVQALNTLYNRADSALAATVGASGFNAVNVSGMGTIVSAGNTLLLTGYCYYNGQLLYAPAGLNGTPTPTAGNSLYVIIGSLDALPTVGLASFPTGTANDAAKFAYSSIVPYSASLITTLSAKKPLTLAAAWSNVSPTVGYRTNGGSEIIGYGLINNNFTISTPQDIMTLPVGARPVVDIILAVPAHSSSGAGGLYLAYIQILSASGVVSLVNNTGGINTFVNIDLSGIRFFNS